jgi:hypothetical protein
MQVLYTSHDVRRAVRMACRLQGYFKSGVEDFAFEMTTAFALKDMQGPKPTMPQIAEKYKDCLLPGYRLAVRDKLVEVQWWDSQKFVKEEEFVL